jgi:hypothetical protein
VDSLGGALLMGAAITAVLAVYNLLRHRSRDAALKAGRALREKQ